MAAPGVASSPGSMDEDRSRRLCCTSAPPPAPAVITSRRSAPPPPAAPVTLLQAEEGSATGTAGEEEEQRRNAEAKERIEIAKAIVAFAFLVLSGCLSLFPSDANHQNNVPLVFCLLLAFTTFVSGSLLMLLTITMLGLRADMVTDGQHVAAKCLAVSCTVLSVLTLFSLLALLRSRPYQYIGVATVTAVVLLAAAGVHLCLRRRTGGGGDDEEAYNEEHKKELEAASKTTSCITNSAFGTLVAVLCNAPKISGAAADAVDGAVYVAIFFLFTTAILSVLVMTVSRKVPGITEPRIQRRFTTGIRLANAVLLCSLACAAFAAAFVVLEYRIFAAFAPLVLACIICVPPWHRVVRRRGRAAGEAQDHERENQEEQVKEIEDIASKVTFGGMMAALAGTIGGGNYSGQQAGARGAFMVVLTSAFVSGLGIMLLATAPGTARAYLPPMAKVLIWSSVALIVPVYRVGVWTM